MFGKKGIKKLVRIKIGEVKFGSPVHRPSEGGSERKQKQTKKTPEGQQ